MPLCLQRDKSGDGFALRQAATTITGTVLDVKMLPSFYIWIDAVYAIE